MSHTHVTPSTLKSWYTVRSTETGIAKCHTLVMSYYVQYCYLHCPPRTGGEAEGNGRERCSSGRRSFRARDRDSGARCAPADRMVPTGCTDRTPPFPAGLDGPTYVTFSILGRT
jgi:hypothetical protein